MKRWKDEIAEALEALGGTASYQDIYNQIQRTTSRKLTSEWKATVRREIENNSSESNNYRGGDDIFYPVDGIDARSGRWGLKSMKNSAIDTQKVEKSDKILTDSEITLQPAKLHNLDTHIVTIETKTDSTYSAEKRTWLDDIKVALENLGGIARYEDIYREVKRIRTTPLPEHWEASIRGIVEDNSTDSLRYKGENVFFSVEGIGRGVWGLRERISTPTVNAFDFDEPVEPNRVKQDIYRILRDTFLSRSIKALYKNSCQMCGESLNIKGSPYAEAHHVKPLGRPHNGPDVAANIIILCPNHHVMLDYGALPLEVKKLKIHPVHTIGLEFVEYYNKVIVNS